jgi:ABC-type transport system involved in cytochrome bd biosynthesis fused ATPase/permease subunit
MHEDEYIVGSGTAPKSAKPKSPKPEKAPSKGSAFSQILNGDFLTKEFVLNNLNYIFFIMLLLILVVAKGYYGKQVNKDLDNAQRELDQNTAEFIEAKARLELRTRRYKLAEKLAEKEIKETKNATKVIRLKKSAHE